MAIFVMQECPSALETRLTAIGIKMMMLDNGSDITELLALIEQLQPTGIVIDGYQFSEHYRKSLSALGLPIVAMDDGTIKHPLQSKLQP